MATPGPLLRSSCPFAGIHRESSTGLNAEGRDAFHNANRVNSSPMPSAAASAQGANRRHEGTAERGDSTSALGWVTGHWPDELRAGIALDESDSLLDISSDAKLWLWAARRPLAVSRLSRFRSARMSDAFWYRRSRSFSSALLIMSSSFDGRSGFNRTGANGARFRIASVITPDVSPRNGTAPVAIS